MQNQDSSALWKLETEPEGKKTVAKVKVEPETSIVFMGATEAGEKFLLLTRSGTPYKLPSVDEVRQIVTGEFHLEPFKPIPDNDVDEDAAAPWAGNICRLSPGQVQQIQQYISNFYSNTNDKACSAEKPGEVIMQAVTDFEYVSLCVLKSAFVHPGEVVGVFQVAKAMLAQFL